MGLSFELPPGGDRRRFEEIAFGWGFCARVYHKDGK